MDKREYGEKLGALREEIDRIDRALLPLFIERMGCSEAVARLKKEAGQPVYSAQREAELLREAEAAAGTYGPEARAVLSAVMAVSRGRQYRIVGGESPIREMERTAQRQMPAAPKGIVCQGVAGAYSHEAAMALFPGAEIRFAPSFGEVFETVRRGDAEFGVVPVENSAAGSVTAVYDLILRYRFFIVGAKAVKVEHCLATAVPESPVQRVVSHPQALSQCREYIAKKGFETEAFSNTAAAAAFVAKERCPGLAALCSEAAAEKYGLTVLEHGVQDEKNNRTRFVVISRDPILPENAGKISLCFSIPHEPGSLTGVLERFSLMGLNMTKIESRPIPSSDFEYDFYLDFTGCVHDPDTLELICALGSELPRFSFLGNYLEA